MNKNAKNILQKEKEFRDLVRDLLLAERSVLQAAQKPFTREKLHEILGRFSDIIAGFIGADSCTIHLVLYDPIETNVKDSIPAKRMKETLDSRCAGSNLQAHRRRHYQSILTFPYWWSGKGVMQLAASNQSSVWKEVLKAPQNKALAFTHLTTGITTIIVQDKLPRVRDRWQIREMRHWKKLGPRDTQVWSNSTWERVFRNYYGVPIQIHAAGETVGLLKLENKKWKNTTNRVAQIFDMSLGQAGPACKRVMETLMEAFPDNDPDEPPHYEPFSFLARAYLLLDIRSVWQNFSSGKLFAGYSEPPSETVLLPKKGRAPVQLFTLETQQEERLLSELIDPSEKEKAWIEAEIGVPLAEKDSLSKALLLLLTFDKCLEHDLPENAHSGAENYVNAIKSRLTEALTTTLKPRWEIEVKPWPRMEGNEAHFAYEIVLTQTAADTTNGSISKEENLKLICVIPPSTGELSALVSHWENEGFHNCAAFYRRFLETAQAGQQCKVERKEDGEFAIINDAKNGSAVTLRVRDLWIDRMAARAQALVFAVPVPAFTSEDTRLLTWAAFEIGKLIERRIAYHANQGRDPMPLTSVEFFRIPISCACFVDDLRTRRNNAERVKNHLDHHFKNLVFLSDINKHHEFAIYRSRIKRYDSYLMRMGERWEGHIRGSLAIYFYLLSKTLGDMKEAQCGSASTNDEADDRVESNLKIGFFMALGKFAHALEKGKGASGSEEHGSLARLADDLDVLRNEQLPEAMKFWIGDVDFLSPPLAGTFQDFKSAHSSIVSNLRCGGISGLPNSLALDAWRNSSEFVNLIFRNYDAFLGNSASLLCQVLNRANKQTNPEMFCQFYGAAYHLKDLLGGSWREMEEEDLRPLLAFWKGQMEPESNGPINWDQLLSYVATHETKDFMQHFRPDEAKEDDADNTPRFLLPLTATGIYKRIRMLADTLHHQRASAHLDWLTRRFDFLGCRLTCLYKNQVFALYEQLWNQGDPFFLYDMEEAEPKPFLEPNATHRRTRWLCLRTNVHEEEYRALQIAALADPSAIETGHWDISGYNLRKLKKVLGELFTAYEPDGAEKYKYYACNRNRLRLEYLKWFQTADAGTRQEEDERARGVAEEVVEGRGPDFGEFLCAAVFDLVLARYASGPASDGTPDVGSLSDAMGKFLTAAKEYTESLLQYMESPDIAFLPPPKLCQSAEDLYEMMLRGSWKLSGQEEEHIKKEKERLLGKTWPNTQTCGADWGFPAVWAPPARFSEWMSVLEASDDCGVAKTERLIRLWECIRREQKEFLFHRDGSSKMTRGAGLRWRERESVLDRISNYVLLFDPKNPIFDSGDFKGWTAYDLFYYVRSLVPVEIQIRTALADTMAEQYHDAIYKGRRKEETEAPRKRLQELSKRLAELDNEMEIDFEDFADREMESVRNETRSVRSSQPSGLGSVGREEASAGGKLECAVFTLHFRKPDNAAFSAQDMSLCRREAEAAMKSALSSVLGSTLSSFELAYAGETESSLQLDYVLNTSFVVAALPYVLHAVGEGLKMLADSSAQLQPNVAAHLTLTAEWFQGMAWRFTPQKRLGQIIPNKRPDCFGVQHRLDRRTKRCRGCLVQPECVQKIEG